MAVAHFAGFTENLEGPTFSVTFMGHVIPLGTTFPMVEVHSLRGDHRVNFFSNCITVGLDLDAISFLEHVTVNFLRRVTELLDNITIFVNDFIYVRILGWAFSVFKVLSFLGEVIVEFFSNCHAGGLNLETDSVSKHVTVQFLSGHV